MVNQAKVIPDHIVGYLEKGTFAGTRVLENGTTAKVTVNDVVYNGSLTPPPDLADPFLIGTKVRENTHYAEDNRARVIVPGIRIRTYESTEYTVAEGVVDLAGGPLSPKAQ